MVSPIYQDVISIIITDTDKKLQQGEENYSEELHNLLSGLHPTRIGFLTSFVSLTRSRVWWKLRTPLRKMYLNGQNKDSEIYVEIKCQLDATDDFYCRSYCLLNMFRAPYTHHQGLESIIQKVAAWKPKHQIPQAATFCIIFSSSWCWA